MPLFFFNSFLSIGNLQSRDYQTLILRAYRFSKKKKRIFFSIFFWVFFEGIRNFRTKSASAMANILQFHRKKNTLIRSWQLLIYKKKMLFFIFPASKKSNCKDSKVSKPCKKVTSKCSLSEKVKGVSYVFDTKSAWFECKNLDVARKLGSKSLP